MLCCGEGRPGTVIHLTSAATDRARTSDIQFERHLRFHDTSTESMRWFYVFH